MPPRSQEEKERRKKLREERQAAKLEKKKNQSSDTRKASVKKSENGKQTSSHTSVTLTQRKQKISSSPLLSLPEDAVRHIFCFLLSKELGAMIMTCRTLNRYMGESRVMHLLARLQRPAVLRPDKDFDGNIRAALSFCSNESEVREIIKDSLKNGDNTGRLVTKKSKKAAKNGDADEYISYARFVEEAVSGYTIQTTGSKAKSLYLPPKVNGKFASVSPEHSVFRLGGGDSAGAGGSGACSWGVGRRGQLGHGKRKDEKEPRPLIGGIGYRVRIVQVSAGGGLVRVAHTLLLTSTGRVLSFGTAQYGQLGHGYSAGKQLSDVLRPQYIQALSGMRCTCVSAGELHSACVNSDGDLYTWGDGFCGQLGLGDKRPQLLPLQVTEGGLEDECVLSVTCGNRHTLCITEEGEVFSFGLGHFGVLGRSFTPFQYDADAAIVAMGPDLGAPLPDIAAEANEINDNAEPVHPYDIPIEEQAPAAISAEMREHLDLLANLTLDDNSDQCIPKVIEALQGIKIIAACAGHRHSIVLDEDGSVFTFGSGLCGALGHGSIEKEDLPRRVMEFDNINVKITQISAGVDISMAVSTEGAVFAWGKSADGRIGLGLAHNEVSIPRRVSIPDKEEFKAVDVECGYVHSLIVGLDGTVLMCGGVGVNGEDDGQMDENHDLDENNKGKPKQIAGLNIWHRIPEAKENQVAEKWKKYGKYELKGRQAMLAEKEKWEN